MDIDYTTFNRLLVRAEEVATEPDANASVKRVYDDRTHEPAMVFRNAHTALGSAETKAKKETGEGRAALAAIDSPYRVTRSAALSFVPSLTLPSTLKQQPTDTDKMLAIRSLLRELDARDETEAWAAAELAGEFGRLAPDTIREIEEWVQANKDLQHARDARASATGLAYERFLAFKDVVRQAYGSKSRQYKRIHLRSAAEEPEPEPTP
jgi:hypothetical protein